MDKAVEIKRRAQRCVQNGDLDGALSEYEKLIAADDTDPYNYVLLADLLYKKSDQPGAAERYLAAAEAYERAGLFKNGIAVCKKMLRLSLAPGTVLKRLASLHALDGLGTEAALYYMQYAEQMVRADDLGEAAEALRKAYDAANENVKALERLAEVQQLREDTSAAARTLAEAAKAYSTHGQLQAAEQCRIRARELDPSALEDADSAATPSDDSLPSDAAAAPEDGPGTATGAAPESTGSPEPNALDGGMRTIESAWSKSREGDTAPGLKFGSGAAGEGSGDGDGLGGVEAILAEAQEHFKNGDREAAADALARAAQTYEKLGSLENAATIYRSLGKSAQTPVRIMEAWFENCQKRRDTAESAEVACELGDRALNEDRKDDAQRWFEKAVGLDARNEHARRRLQRLSGKLSDVKSDTAPAGEATAKPKTPSKAPAAQAPQKDTVAPKTGDKKKAPDEKETPAVAKDGGAETGRVDVAVGRGEAVTFDLGSLISEFQRGVDAQLSGDAQSHYDLAMAYREMGLLEQAVDSFRIAAAEPEFAARCAEMIGRCLLDQGRFEDAAQEFGAALTNGTLDVDTEVSLRYQLGLAHEAAGRTQDALTEFEGVYSAQPNYPDVALKIRVLRKSLESNS